MSFMVNFCQSVLLKLEDLFVIFFPIGSWKRDLLKYIDVHQLPVHYGGTQFGEDGDTMCKNQVRDPIVCTFSTTLLPMPILVEEFKKMPKRFPKYFIP